MNFKTRRNHISNIQDQLFDLVIIGGGVTGAGIALDAVSRGLKVVLIEKGDFASGTSSKSTKLIHGGLRYLKQMDFALVRESGMERAIVHQLAPHLVIPEKMLLPLIEGGSYGKFLTSLGLKLYDILANVEGEDRRQMLDVEKALAKEPLLKKDKLKGAGFYAEYRTDDARLTIELIKKASQLGAICLNYFEYKDSERDEKGVFNVACQDRETGLTHHIRSRCVVSAAGPWVDKIREKDGSRKGKSLHLTKGVHIVVAREKLPVRQTVYFDVPDGRMIFAIPRQRVTYIGTTDTNYTKGLDNIRVSKQDVQYLLDAVNNTFEGISLSITDIESSWAGLRPLIHEDGKSPSELSRKDEIFISPTGLISIAGGKLTGYRKMAKRIVDLVYETLDKDDPGCKTKEIKLTSRPVSGRDTISQLKNKVEDILEHMSVSDSHLTDYLVSTYGAISTDIVSNISSEYQYPTNLILTELDYCLKHEMVLRVSDFIVRRTGRLYFNLAEAKKEWPTVLSYMSDYFDWDEERIESEKAEMHKLIEEAITFV